MERGLASVSQGKGTVKKQSTPNRRMPRQRVLLEDAPRRRPRRDDLRTAIVTARVSKLALATALSFEIAADPSPESELWLQALDVVQSAAGAREKKLARICGDQLGFETAILGQMIHSLAETVITTLEPVATPALLQQIEASMAQTAALVYRSTFAGKHAQEAWGSVQDLLDDDDFEETEGREQEPDEEDDDPHGFGPADDPDVYIPHSFRYSESGFCVPLDPEEPDDDPQYDQRWQGEEA